MQKMLLRYYITITTLLQGSMGMLNEMREIRRRYMIEIYNN